MPHRLDRAELERDLRRRRSGARRRGDALARASISCATMRGSLMLLTPPFDTTPHDPGYIKGYLPGVRENGAQYTHAALWAVLATALRGDGDRAFELFQMLNPLTHARAPQRVDDPTRSSPTSWPPTSTPRRVTSDAAGGRGTPARRAGCIASGSRRSSASRKRGDTLTIRPTRAGDVADLRDHLSPPAYSLRHRRPRSRSDRQRWGGRRDRRESGRGKRDQARRRRHAARGHRETAPPVMSTRYNSGSDERAREILGYLGHRARELTLPREVGGHEAPREAAKRQPGRGADDDVDAKDSR